MPDWFYRTVAQPALFRLPDRLSRKVALGTIGVLGRSRIGGGLIDFLGHMEADPRLKFEKMGLVFSSPIGLGWRVDPDGLATEGLARFGVGAVEVLENLKSTVEREQGMLSDQGLGPGITRQTGALEGVQAIRRVITKTGVHEAVLSNGTRLKVLNSWTSTDSDELGSYDGLLLELGRQRAGLESDPIQQVEAWKLILTDSKLLVVSGGVDSPDQAVDLKQAGADLILIDAGLVFKGPGLVKRCQDALLSSHSQSVPSEHLSQVGLFNRSWVWAVILGAAMLLGGLATFALSLTHVLLPYDEHYLGLTSEMLRLGKPKLFSFMAHDRATLAGTMIGLGWTYIIIGFCGIRRSEHGAKSAIVSSALAGFISFFAFFGFGYFDTLHAFVAAVLFQITVQIMVGRSGGVSEAKIVIDLDDGVRTRALWGQLFWLVHAGGLLIAGLVIIVVGVSSVFVTEDLDFLCMTLEEIRAMGSKIVAVVAHDRATLGGMLLAAGTAMLLPVLWSFRRSASWLWYAILGLGIPAYLAAIGIHLKVGYTDPRHLIPAFAGMSLWLGGVLLSRRYLCNRT